MLTKCPFCDAGVIPKKDGTCPSCNKHVPQVNEAAKTQAKQTDSPSQSLPSTASSSAASSTPASSSPTRVETQELREFFTHLHRLTPNVYITQVVIAINVLVYVAMLIAGVDWFSPKPQDLISWGGNQGITVVAGETYRLFTCMWLHAGIIHLALNMYIFFQVGMLVERFLGNVSFLIVYLLTGLFASLTTLYWNVFEQPFVVSVGASGALFGVFGTLLGLMLRSDQTVPKALSREILRNLLVLLGYNLLFSYMIPAIDMAAHSGGLIAGFVFGLILSSPIRRESSTTRWIRTGLVVAISLPLIAAAIFWMPKGATEYYRVYDLLLTTQDEVLPIQEEAEQKYKDRKITNIQFAETVETKVLPPWRILQSEFRELKTIPDAEQERYECLVQYVDAYGTLFEELSQDLIKDDAQVWQESYAENSKLVQESLKKLNALKK